MLRQSDSSSVAGKTGWAVWSGGIAGQCASGHVHLDGLSLLDFSGLSLDLLIDNSHGHQAVKYFSKIPKILRKKDSIILIRK